MLPQTIDYPDDITLIDTEQERKAMAACYLVRSGDAYAFIDCGTSLSVPAMLRVLARRGIAREQIAYVMPTHVHLDHAGGAGALLRACPNAQLVVHPRGAKHLIDPAALVAGATAVYGADNMAAMYGKIVPVPESRVIVADEGFTLDFNGRPLRFIDAPGHARHHYAVWDARSRGWFTGDTFGLSYREFDGPNGPFLIPTTTPVQFEPDAWLATLERFLARQPQWMYLTHYGRVGDVEALAADLRGALCSYQSIALHCAPGQDRHRRLVDALTTFTLEELAANGNPLTEDEARHLLAMDMELNAQGLGIWLDRRAAAARPATV